MERVGKGKGKRRGGESRGRRERDYGEGGEGRALEFTAQ